MSHRQQTVQFQCHCSEPGIINGTFTTLGCGHFYKILWDLWPRQRDLHSVNAHLFMWCNVKQSHSFTFYDDGCYWQKLLRTVSTTSKSDMFTVTSEKCPNLTSLTQITFICFSSLCS